MNVQELLLAASLCTVASGALAQPPDEARRTDFDAGAAAGAYITAADMIAAFKESRCGYALRKPYPSVTARVAEVTKHLTPRQREELTSYLSSSNYQQFRTEIRQIVPNALELARRDGADERTTCGMLIAALHIQVKKGESIWAQYLGRRPHGYAERE